MKKIYLVLIMMLLILGGCGKKDMSMGTIQDIKYEETEDVTNYVKIVTNKDKVILIELKPEDAPITVENFKNLVKEKYYDGTIFHRVIKDFMVQTGGFNKDGALENVANIKGEFASNGVENNLKHDIGVVSMARAQDMDSGSSQFFICVNDSDSLSYLDGQYAAFGQVIAGYEVVEEISKVATDEYDMPMTTQSIKTIRFVNITQD